MMGFSLANPDWLLPVMLMKLLSFLTINYIEWCERKWIRTRNEYSPRRVRVQLWLEVLSIRNIFRSNIYFA